MFARGDEGLAVFLAQAFPILVITYVNLSLGIVDAADVATNFTQAATTTAASTVASTSLDAVNL